METLLTEDKEDCLMKTRCVTTKYTFKWIIEDYSRLKNQVLIKSPHFYPEEECAWYAEMHKNEENFWLDIYRGGYGSVFVDCRYLIHSNSDKVWQNGKKSFIFSDKHKLVSITSMDLKESEVKDENDIVKVTVHLEINKTVNDQLTRSVKYSIPLKNEIQLDVHKSLLKDLEKFYENSQNTDVSLSIEGETLDVHKAILSARSSVFAKMFQQGMEEVKTNVVVIEDVKMATMKEVVAFMYGTTTCDFDYDTAVEVYYAADKYDLNKLKDICGAILVSKLNEENAYQVLCLSDQHRDADLKRKVMEFIALEVKSCVKSE